MKSKGKAKVRIGVFIPKDVREAMMVVRDNVRVLPSHQVDLALRNYFKQYEGLLKEHGISL